MIISKASCILTLQADYGTDVKRDDRDLGGAPTLWAAPGALFFSEYIFQRAAGGRGASTERWEKRGAWAPSLMWSTRRWARGSAERRHVRGVRGVGVDEAGVRAACGRRGLDISLLRRSFMRTNEDICLCVLVIKEFKKENQTTPLSAIHLNDQENPDSGIAVVGQLMEMTQSADKTRWEWNRKFLKIDTSEGGLSPLENLYKRILTSFEDIDHQARNATRRADRLAGFQHVIGTILVLREPLTVREIIALLADIPSKELDVAHFLQQFRTSEHAASEFILYPSLPCPEWQEFWQLYLTVVDAKEDPSEDDSQDEMEKLHGAEHAKWVHSVVKLTRL
ncbi:hypothetical protein B0H14DRAFT_2643531 [Mycena olivaceomarginata]|nr:hypothetical protein B0H14DRAFT_2643531 [Mycena olivaceomarginata]